MHIDLFSFLFGIVLNWFAEGIFLLFQFLKYKVWRDKKQDSFKV